VAAARLGARVTFVARVGTDAFGQEAVRSYQADGIDTTHVQIDPERPTGTAVIVVDDRAENAILVVAGANAGLRGLSRTTDGDVAIGDIIVGIDGQKISTDDDVYRVLDKHQLGDSVNVEVLRNGRRATIPVKLTDTPPARRGRYNEE